MATATVTASTSAYTLVSSANNFLVQNISTYPVKVTFASSLPNNSTEGHILFPGQNIQKTSGVPADSLYVIGVNYDGLVAVSE